MSGNRVGAELVRDLGWGAWWVMEMYGAWCGVRFGRGERQDLTAELGVEKKGSVCVKKVGTSTVKVLKWWIFVRPFFVV